VALGVAANLAVGLGTLASLFCAVGLLGMLALQRLELSYVSKAATVAAVSSAAMVVSTVGRQTLHINRDDATLAALVVLLSAALWFRAWYRGSKAARALVGTAVALSAAWAIITSHHGLLILGFTWQSWMPALLWYVFCVLCLLALLAFMGNETTGGCNAWAAGLCVWYGLFAVTRFALEDEMIEATDREILGALGLAQPAFSAPLAVATAQLLAHFIGSRARRSPRPHDALSQPPQQHLPAQ
jgi:hypothetical protein